MNSKDKIILYLDNQMSPPEKQKFEEELKNSPELSREMDKLKITLDKLKELNVYTADENYFADIVPSLRKNLEKHKKYIYKRIIYASSAAVFILLVISLFLFRNSPVVPEEGFVEMNDEQLNKIAGNYNILESDTVLASVNDSVWNELIVDEFNFSNEYADSILRSFNGNISYADYLSDEEVSLVYDRLINKEIF